MINNEVPVTVIRRPVDHSSTAMTDVYARISDETLKREFEKFNNRVNIHGEVIPIDPAGLINEAAWMKERLARRRLGQVHVVSPVLPLPNRSRRR